MSTPHRIIRASAGSGKTFRLTSRYLALLASGVPARTILATTFTRKAAGEILGRVLGRLATAAADDGARAALSRAVAEEIGRPIALSEARCRAMLRELAMALHRLAISTIDSFFSRVVAGFRYELDMPVEPQLVEEGHPLARQLRLEAIEAMLSDDDVHVLLGLLRRLHHDSAARSVTRAIDNIVGQFYETYRQADSREQWMRIDAPPGLLEDAALIGAVEELAGAGPLLPRDQRWIKAFAKDVQAAQARDWEGFLGRGLAKAVDQGQATYGRKPFESALLARYEPLVQHARASEIDQYIKLGEATYDLLHRFDAHYAALRRQHGVLLFADVTHKLANVLPELGPEVLLALYYRLDGRVNQLLLDEFQDTSLDQWRVLAPMAREIFEQGDGSRGLFCVGDTKQAIYGWRGGCVELFDDLEAAMATQEGASERLSRSYRSSQVVLNAVNRTFSTIAGVLTLREDQAAVQRWQDDFEAHEAARDLPGHVMLTTSPADGVVGRDAGYAPEADRDDDEAAADEGFDGPVMGTVHEAFVARRVLQLHEQAPRATIGILVARNATVQRLLFELRKIGLPASGEGGNALTDVPAVAAVLAAMTLADHPGHSAAAFHVANSPLGQVLGLRSTHERDTSAAALRIREQLLEHGYAGLIAQWVRALAPSCGGWSLARLEQLVEVAQRYGPIVSLRPSEFVAFVEATPVEEPMPAPIRVMTVHAAKGLEFDAVVLPELGRRVSNRWPVLVGRDEPTGSIQSVYRYASQGVRERLPAVMRAYEDQRARQRHDDLCKLYVAMTRARHGLYMIVEPREPKADGSPRSIGTCFAAMLREQLAQHDESYTGQEVLYEDGSANWCDAFTAGAAGGAKGEARETVLTAVSLGEAGDRPRRSWLSISPSSLEGAAEVRAGELLDVNPHHRQAKARGTLIHAWLEQVGFLDEPGAMPADADLLALARQRMPGSDEAWLARELASFHAALECDAAQQILHRQGASELWRERSFAVRAGDGRLVRGTFDRVAVWRAGGAATAATLVDFKTDQIADADGLRQAVERYRPQVLAYREALGRMLRLEPTAVRARLMFLTCGEVVRV